ncbi:programmed cell death 1 ligand 1-like [Cyprinodon tularosa]|uniref:programmed cell death 1 ligand 1-like n=1 Tax=Cyprinodon tularosa TaxID=77115 RepID=UPI0018E2027A|nr:programmed cell death 1 ligand 1-like [Cyprinodon tularosa]
MKTVFCSSVSENQKLLSVEPGQNILLPCRAPDGRPVLAVEWTRTDLDPEYVFLFRDEQTVPSYQHPSFRDRVDLQDRQMKNGDISLILTNVRSEDRGTYECRVFQAVNKIRKRANLESEPISIITLDVAPRLHPDVISRTWGDAFRNRGGSVGPSVGLLLVLTSVLQLWVW